jgi:iron complex outermembrane receptor protein
MNIKFLFYFIVLLSLSVVVSAEQVELGTVYISADVDENNYLSDTTTKKVTDLAQKAKGETLGDYLENEQFVDSASYGPAVGRPVIKGMDGYRVGIVKGNIILNDLSAMSQDHAVAVMPRASQKIEIIKGPSSLLYGNYSGGVIHVLGEEHKSEFLKEGYGIDVSSQYGSNGAGHTSGAIVKVSDSNLSLYANTFYTKSQNYRDGANNLINDTDTLSLQSHLVLGYQINASNIIKAYYDSLTKEYGIANSTQKRTAIDMQQETYGVIWHNKELFEGVNEFQNEIRYSDYLHSELKGNRDDGLFGQEQLTLSSLLDVNVDEWNIKTHFQYVQGELQVCHEHGKCTSFYDAKRTDIQDGIEIQKNIDTLGLPFSHGHPMPNIDESSTQLGINAATYLDDDTEFTSTLRVEYRYLQTDSSNIQEEWLVNSNIDPNYYSPNNDLAVSFSTGISGYLTDSLSYQSSIAYIERLPSSTEMFWNGFHHATDSYIFGNRYLENEKSVNLDVSLMHELDNFTTVLGAFYYDFQNYIFQESLAESNGTLVLDPFHNSSVWKVKGEAARVYGVAFKEKYSTSYQAHKFNTTFDVEMIQGVLKSGGYIPRMTPYNAALELEHNYRDIITTTLKYKYVDESRFVAKNETFTPSYSWLSLYVAYEDKFKYGSYSLYFKGENLTNELAYNHLSFLKESAPLAGRQLSIGASFTF